VSLDRQRSSHRARSTGCIAVCHSVSNGCPGSVRCTRAGPGSDVCAPIRQRNRTKSSITPDNIRQRRAGLDSAVIAVRESGAAESLGTRRPRSTDSDNRYLGIDRYHRVIR
jgi:hypothetical protein